MLDPCEPPNRILRATIPESESQPKSMILPSTDYSQVYYLQRRLKSRYSGFDLAGQVAWPRHNNQLFGEIELYCLGIDGIISLQLILLKFLRCPVILRERVVR